MTSSMSTDVPEPGFYYSYKHDPSGEVNNYAYEVRTTGTDTDSGSAFIVYRRLYEAPHVYVRLLSKWIEKAEKDGSKVSRYKKVTHPRAISQLSQIREQMYGRR